jgi:hypothetical protein
MGGPRPSRAAKWFRLVVIAGAAVLSLSVVLPWCRISGFTYTFLGVDSWKALPVAEVAVSAIAALAAMISLNQIKRIGLLLGGTALVLNLAGAFVAARLANVHNPDVYFRIWAVITIVPAWGGWLALLTCTVLIWGALSRWSVRVSYQGTAQEVSRSIDSERAASGEIHGIPKQFEADEGAQERRYGLPRLGEVFGSPGPSGQMGQVRKR